jgi:hypothetical protein
MADRKRMSAKRTKKQVDFMLDPLEGMAFCLEVLNGGTTEEAEEQARREVFSLLRLDEPAPATSFTDADIIRAHGMGINYGTIV